MNKTSTKKTQIFCFQFSPFIHYATKVHINISPITIEIFSDKHFKQIHKLRKKTDLCWRVQVLQSRPLCNSEKTIKTVGYVTWW